MATRIGSLLRLPRKCHRISHTRVFRSSTSFEPTASVYHDAPLRIQIRVVHLSGHHGSETKRGRPFGQPLCLFSRTVPTRKYSRATGCKHRGGIESRTD